MASAKGIIAKLDAALKRLNVTDRQVYKRTTARVGGDDLIGRAVTVTSTEVLLSPPPIYQRLGRNVVGNNVSAEMFISTSGTKDQIGVDYSILFSPSSITRNELADPNLTIVFKDASGNEEVFRITDYELQPFQGVDVEILAYLRSTKRATGT